MPSESVASLSSPCWGIEALKLSPSSNRKKKLRRIPKTQELFYKIREYVQETRRNQERITATEVYSMDSVLTATDTSSIIDVDNN